MIRSTLIARLSNGLPLAESMDDEELQREFPDYKMQTKGILKSLGHHSDPKCTIESGHFNFHYMIDQGVCYLCISDKLFPKRLAFSYLEELSSEFYARHGKEIEAAQRPYAFIQFDTTIQRIKKTYKDSKTQQNLTRLNEELHNVTRIMTKNIQDVLQRGEKIDKLGFMSSHLTTESKKYAKETRQLNLQLLYRKYGTPALFFLILFGILYFWWTW